MNPDRWMICRRQTLLRPGDAEHRPGCGRGEYPALQWGDLPVLSETALLRVRHPPLPYASDINDARSVAWGDRCQNGKLNTATRIVEKVRLPPLLLSFLSPLSVPLPGRVKTLKSPKSLIKNTDFSLGTYRACATIAWEVAIILSFPHPVFPLPRPHGKRKGPGGR